MFLGGLIMFATGLCLILNYDIFDESVLSPEMRTEDGKRTVGIILTICGLLAIFVSVLVSVLYLCNRPKPHQVNPDDLSQIPSTARNGTPDSGGARRKTSDHKVNRLPDGMHVQHRNPPGRTNVRPTPPIMGSTEVKHPRPYKKRHRHKNKGFPRQSRLEEIKEADAISRKTVEGAVLAGDGSFSSEITLDESRKPKIVLNHDYLGYDRPPSVESGSISGTSDTSNYRTLENDKSRRELQFIPDAKGRDSLTGFETSSKDSLLDDNSLVVAYTSALEKNNIDNRENSEHNTSEDRDSAAGSEESNRRGSSGTNSQVLPDSGLNESDGNASLSSYTAQQGTVTRDAKLNTPNSPDRGGIVNASYIPNDNDVNIPGQSDVTSEEGDEVTPAQTWRSDETAKDDMRFER